MSRLAERPLDRLPDFRGRGRRLGVEAGDDGAAAVDEKLGEVPLDVAGAVGLGRLLREPGVEPGARRAVDVIFENIGNVTPYFVVQNALTSASLPGSCPANCTREADAFRIPLEPYGARFPSR